MIIGLTGKNAAGKGEAADYLIKKGFSYHSLSDIIRDELKKENIEENRENLIKKGNDLRESFGAGVLAIKTIAKIKKIKSKNFVIDSIRNPIEVDELRKLKDFRLICIDAPIEIRFQRALERGRSENAKTLAEFKKLEDKENTSNPKAQQLNATIGKADLTISNDSDLKKLHAKIDKELNLGH